MPKGQSQSAGLSEVKANVESGREKVVLGSTYTGNRGNGGYERRDGATCWYEDILDANKDLIG